MIEDAIFTVLSANAGVSAIIAARIYPALLPQEPVYPALTYTFISESTLPAMGADIGTERRRLQVSCWDMTMTGAQTLADAVTTALSRYQGYIPKNLQVYKSDWQGNQLQYSTPRTNLVGYSYNLANWEAAALAISSSVTIGPDGTNILYTIEVTGANNRCAWNFTSVANQYYTFSVAVTPGTSQYAGLCLDNGGGAIFDMSGAGSVISTVNSQGNVLDAGISKYANGQYRIWMTAYTNLSTILGVGVGVSDGLTYDDGYYPSGAVGSTILAGFGDFKIGTILSSLIPSTGGAPVTVTDYSLSGNDIVFSDAPAIGDALSWSDLNNIGPIDLGTGNGSQTAFATNPWGPSPTIDDIYREGIHDLYDEQARKFHRAVDFEVVYEE